jgi:predicted Zn-dependent protease
MTVSFWRSRAETMRSAPVARVSLLLLSVLSPSAAALCGAEAALAKISADKMEQEWPLRPAADLVSAYVQRLGVRLAPQQEILSPERYLTWDWPNEWRFRVVRDLAPNAFSIGDGRTYVTDGALLAAASEAEMAAILAHEMGHQLAGHFCSSAEGDGGRNHALGSIHQVIDMGREMEADRMAMDILRAANLPPGTMLDVVRKMSAKDPVSQKQRQERERELLNQLRGTPILPAPPSSAEFGAVRQILRPR